ncbi:MAG: AI-2E family transporter [Clostridia bacterium]|nr:AI-2E family transporter [Clostridia bacterium]
MVQGFHRILRQNAVHILFLTSYTGLFFLFVKILPFTFPFLFGAVLLIPARPLHKFLQTKAHLSCKVSPLAVSILLVAGAWSLLTGLFVWLVWEIRALALGEHYFRLDALSPAARGFIDRILKQIPSADSIFSDLLPSAFPAVLPFVGRILRFCISLPAVILFPILTFMTLYYSLRYHRKIGSMFARWVPLSVLRRIRRVIRKRSGSGFSLFAAYLTLYLITFCESCIIFSLLKIPYPLITAFLACFADCIPLIGPGTVYLILALYRLLCGMPGQALGLVFGWFMIGIIRQIIEPKLLKEISRTPSLAIWGSIYVSFLLGHFWPVPYVVLFFFLKGILIEAGLLKAEIL